MFKRKFRIYSIETWALCYDYYKYVNYIHIYHDCAYWQIMYWVNAFVVVAQYVGQWRGNHKSAVNSSHNGTNEPKWVSVLPMLYDMVMNSPE